jgi:PAS domain S-box-containing protein
MTGYRPDELIGRNWWDTLYPGELRADVDRLYNQFTKGDVSGFEMTLRGKDGRPRTIVWNSFNIVDRDRGGLVEINGAGTDITQVKANEETLKRLNEKLGLLGDITRHDVLNQLSVLLGWVDIAIEDVKDAKTKQQLESAKAAAATIRNQLEFTADYQQMGMLRPTWVRAEEALREGVSTLTLGGVKITSDLGEIEIFADPMVPKVFHNLVDNSLRHGRKVDRIHVYLRKDRSGPRIVYEDNGVGIPPKDKKLVFERGYGKHTGYGLHLSREILAITGIGVEETGEEGKGVRFEFVLPPGTFKNAEGA